MSYHFTNAQIIIAVTVLVLVVIAVGEYLQTPQSQDCSAPQSLRNRV